MFSILELIRELKTADRVFIQTHNFPDHDAVASAFGLSKLFREFDIEAPIIYKGELQRDSLIKMIENLGIEIYKYDEFELVSKDKIVIVDGCKGNSNVEDLIGDEIAVIDHHKVSSPEEVKYIDIREDCGSCSTIIYSYYKQLKVPVAAEVASALIIGLNMDTAQLTRGVSEDDIKAYPDLYVLANMNLVNAILRNYIQTKDLSFYKYLIDNIKIENRVAYCYFDMGCNQNLLGILGDFILALEEVDFVILCAKNGGIINFSIRNENSRLNAAAIILEALKGIGFGGGHNDMSGGVVKEIDKFNDEAICEKFRGIIYRELQ
jgi:nanoRNase/pAp phosphatase (c-di-AMP/oligoRNAs hydrolase)